MSQTASKWYPYPMSEKPDRFPPLHKFPSTDPWEDSSIKEEPSIRGTEFLAESFGRIGIEFNKQSKILEVGTGTGVTLASLRQGGYDAVGVDARPRGTYGKEGVAQARIEALPFQDETFDFILSTLVFDSEVYEQDTDRMTSEIVRVLKAGGIYAASEPHGRRLGEILVQKGLSKLPKRIPFHDLYRKDA